MSTLTDNRLSTDRDRMHAAYWPTRHYWRELAEQNAPHLAPRDLVRAARILHAVAWADQNLTADGSTRPRQTDDDNGRTALELQWREVLAPRQMSDPRDVAMRAAAIALDNVSTYRDGDRGRDPRWLAPAAPDPFEGTRHQTTSKRSNSGRTVTTVTRSGVAPVIGRADRTAAELVKVTRCYGRGLPVPTAWRSLVPRHRVAHTRYVERPTVAPAVPMADQFHAAIGLHLLEHGPRRSGHANALHVMSMTARLYGMPMVSDLTEHPEVTPELPAFDPRGVAVHRSDMSGATGLLALTASQTAADLKRWDARTRLPAVKVRKGERDRGLLTSADDNPRTVRDVAPVAIERDDRGRVTYISRANCQHDYRRAYDPPIWFAVSPDGTVTADPNPRVWSGHHLVKRADLADRTAATRGNMERRTIGTLELSSPSVAAVQTIAADLAPGERVVIATPDGTTARMNRGRDGRYSATLTTADGTRIGKQLRTRTPDAIARKVHAVIG